MIVVLHGMPGDGARWRLHETGWHEFTDIVRVDMHSVSPPPWPMKSDEPVICTEVYHILTFRFTYYDGNGYHYNLEESYPPCPSITDQ